ncbi:MAG: MFS transporter [Solirubrobacterales bacterium]|nr:MFS transporter [Solirubrobacterales bacterium]
MDTSNIAAPPFPFRPCEKFTQLPSRSAPACSRRSRSRRLTIAFACVAMLVCYLPFSAVNGVLGAIGASTGASTSDLQWVTDAFTVALAGTVLSGGVLAARCGPARVTLAGLTLTGLGSVLGLISGAVSPSHAIQVLWAGQGLAGIGGGLVMSASLELIIAVAGSAADRARAIGLWAGANVVALGGGPFLSGWLSDWTSWRWLYVPVLACVLGTIAVGAVAADSAGEKRRDRLDWAGQLIATLGVLALIYGVISAGKSGWTCTPAMIGTGLGLVLLVGFFVAEQRATNPVIAPQLFVSPGFSAAGVAAMTVLFAVIGTVFVLSLYFAHLGSSGLGIALRLGSLFAGNAMASVLAPRFQTRLGVPSVLVGGLLIAAAGQATLLAIGDSTDLADTAWRLSLFGVGCGLVMATATALAVQSAPPRFAGSAGAANNAIRQIGAALGTAVIGGIFARQLATGASPASAVHLCATVLVAVLLAAAILAAATLRSRRSLTD